MLNASENNLALVSEAKHVSISKSKGIKIEWQDGHISDYGLSYLRDRCPCATCTGAHGTEPRKPEATPLLPIYKPTLKLNGAEPVGNYALRLLWNDGHTTGIYAYEHLRRICPCQQCRKPATGA